MPKTQEITKEVKKEQNPYIMAISMIASKTGVPTKLAYPYAFSNGRNTKYANLTKEDFAALTKDYMDLSTFLKEIKNNPSFVITPKTDTISDVKKAELAFQNMAANKEEGFLKHESVDFVKALIKYYTTHIYAKASEIVKRANENLAKEIIEENPHINGVVKQTDVEKLVRRCSKFMSRDEAIETCKGFVADLKNLDYEDRTENVSNLIALSYGKNEKDFVKALNKMLPQNNKYLKVSNEVKQKLAGDFNVILKKYVDKEIQRRTGKTSQSFIKEEKKAHKKYMAEVKGPTNHLKQSIGAAINEAMKTYDKQAPTDKTPSRQKVQARGL